MKLEDSGMKIETDGESTPRDEERAVIQKGLGGGTPVEMLWKMAAGGGVVGVLAAALIFYNAIQGATDKQAKASIDLELRLRAIETQLVVLPEIRTELKAMSGRPTVTVRDFNRWRSEARRANPTLVLPDFEPMD